MKVLRFFTVVAVLVLMGFAFVGAVALHQWPEPRERIVKVLKPQPTLEELVERTVAKGIPREVIEVILYQEDRRGPRADSKRCEFQSSDWLKRAQAIAKRRNLTEDERDAYRCSYGPWQVAGWHAAAYKRADGSERTWADLLDVETNWEIGADVWLQKMAAAKREARDVRERYWMAFRNYNGSGPRAEKYADEVFGALMLKLFDERFGNG